MEKHELLELILFYAIPRKNTNETAHLLIKKFGSIYELLNAPIEEIADENGMGINSAILIKTYIEVMRIYMEESKNKPNNNLILEDICDIVKIKLLGKSKENIVLVLLNSQMKLLYSGIVREGGINSIDIYIDEIVRLSIKYRAVYAVVAHNHPSGSLLPSKDDIETTKKLKAALKLINVRLIDHIIFAEGECSSLGQSPLGEILFN